MVRSPGSELNDAAVAIIGMAGRFPGCAGVRELWGALRAGRETITVFTKGDLAGAGVPLEQLEDPAYVRARGVLDDAECFDAAFFGISPREAELMDPQQRVFLECAWAGLEDAGYDPERLPVVVGVFAGSGWNSYLVLNLAAHPELFATDRAHQTLLGNEKDNLATRVSYKLNLKGPSVTIQSNCSTSLVAVASAYEALLAYRCDVALAGGVSIVFPQVGYLHHPGAIFSPDGHCRAFDAGAQGTVMGGGAGVVVLKRLKDAIQDGDHVRAVVLAAAMNNDGSEKAGYTAPSIEGQAEVILEAHAAAGVSPDTIAYVEAHGTATPLGDPIEIAALTKAFRVRTRRRGFCALGSVKTNVGHLDAAAGVTGLIKAALALESGEIPPSLNFREPNPLCHLEESPFYVPTQLTPWEANGAPRRAGVSSFGLGGTNVHLILEEAPAIERPARSGPEVLLVSARSPAALDGATDALARHLGAHPDLPLGDVAHTLQAGRKSFPHRRAIVCESVRDAAQALERRDAARVLSTPRLPRDAGFVFLFAGQGAQHVNMARELYRTEACFRSHVDACFDWLRSRHELDLRPVVYPEREEHRAALELRKMAFAQPALFAIEYALARMWMAWGVPMKAALGHSVGEYVAATLAGVFSVEECLSLVAERGQMMQELPAGSMMAVPLPESEVAPLLGSRLSLAAVNEARACVVSGPDDAIEALEGELARRGLVGRRLEATHAAHSDMMEPVLAPFLERVKQVRLAPPTTPFISCVTGTWVTAEQATDPAYWVTHLRHTVRFASGLERALRDTGADILEVAPGRALSQFARRHPALSDQVVLSSLPPVKDPTPERAWVADTLARLWLAGADVRWAEVRAGEPRRRISLPTYPFERQRYWIPPAASIAAQVPAAPDAPAERAWQACVDHARRYVPASAQTPASNRDDVEAACALHLSAWLQRLWRPCAAPESFMRAELLERCQIAPRYQQLVAGWIDLLVGTGHLRALGAHRLGWTAPYGADEARRALEEARRARPDRGAWLDLVEQCAGALTEVVTGRRGPAELFAKVLESSSETPQDAVGPATAYRPILRAAFEGLVGALDPSASLDVLEVGGGTGIATSEVLPLLPPNRARYEFTDVSPLFLAQARQKFGGYPFVRFTPLDVERSPSEQGLAQKAYDVAIAVDVLHATSSISRSLAHLRSVLAPGGLLLVAELTRPTASFAMTYGLLMNPVADPGRSQAAPFLSREAWVTALRAAGFDRVALLPEGGDAGHGVIVARTPAPRGSARKAFETAADAERGAEPKRAADLRKKADLADWFYFPSWRRSTAAGVDARAEPSAERWIVLLDPGGVGHRLAERLMTEGAEVFTVACGDRFQRKTEHAFEVDAARAEDYVTLLGVIARPGERRPANVVHCWGLAPPSIGSAAEQDRRMSLDSIVFLAQALGVHAATDPVQLSVVSSNAYEVTGADVSPVRALGSAPCKVIPLEYPNIRCRSIDFDISSRVGANADEIATKLLEELRRGPAVGTVAYRGAHRWVPALERIRLPAGPDRHLKEGGVYLITGGTGRIGLSLAEDLGKRCKARLVLTQRSRFPAETDWDAWLVAHDEGDRCSRTIRAIRALAAAGAEVIVESADVADREAMRGVVDRARRRFGRIDGVIHAAGVLGDGAMQHKTVAALEAVLAPKVHGTLVLGEVLAGARLDFFVTFSSVSAIRPGFGQVAYAAANAFLDAFVHAGVARNHAHVSSISWDVWQGEGMAYDAHAPAVLQRMKEEDFGRRGILPHEGVEVFRRALASGLPRVIVSTSDYLEILDADGRDLSQLYTAALADRKSVSSRHPRPALAVAYVSPETDTEKALAEIWQELLGLERVGADDDFFELGGDSLIGTQVIARVKRGLGATLSTRAIYAHPTIRRIARAADEALLSGAGIEGVDAAIAALKEEE